jgi:transposase-like protein
MKERRTYTAQQRLKIVLEGLQGENVSEVCRRHQISPTMYYRWRDLLFANADRVFTKQDPGVGERREAQAQEVTRLQGVIAEITAENLELKKTLGPSRIRLGSPPSSGR